MKDLQKQLAKQKKDEESSAPKNGYYSGNSEDVTLLTQENEALIKRAAMFEDELRQADEHLKRVRTELEQKSKVFLSIYHLTFF